MTDDSNFNNVYSIMFVQDLKFYIISPIPGMPPLQKIKAPLCTVKPHETQILLVGLFIYNFIYGYTFASV